MGGSATAHKETEICFHKYKTIKVCVLYIVVVSSVNVCYFQQTGLSVVPLIQRLGTYFLH